MISAGTDHIYQHSKTRPPPHSEDVQKRLVYYSLNDFKSKFVRTSVGGL